MILSERYNYPTDFYERSKSTFETALSTAPAYGAWQALDPGAGAPICERYGAVPELTKQMIRDHFPFGLVPNHRDVEAALRSGEVEHTYTSGTTGERVINIWDQDWWDRAEAASWKLNAHTAGLSYPQKNAKLSSSLNFGISCEEDLPIEYRLWGDRLYLSEKINLIQWQPRHFERMAKELKSFQPVVLEANPSLLARLAYWAMDEGVEMYSPAIIMFTFEFTSKIHLAAIRKVFSSPLISSFGTTETGFVLEECEAGRMHQNIGFCRIDYHPLKDAYGGPELGRMLVTTFGNPWNTVIKFDTGDLIRLHPSGTCECGRNEGLIAEAVEGRVTNVTFTTSGGLVTTMALDDALAIVPGIRDYNFIQHGTASYELQLMLAPDLALDAVGGAGSASGGSGVGSGSGAGRTSGSGSQTADCALEALRALYGADGAFDIKIMKNIYPGPAGKFRRTQANFDYDVGGLFA
ncbi:MAG: hypothetical protein FWH01_08645 [Oscillospiraceae bacterium]|nr:hypothetical protein [Oscillospiraceae bacterium]